MDGFVNKWPRVHCTGCGHWIRRGEKGWRIRDAEQRPRDPVYCGVCGDEGVNVRK